MLYPFCLRHKKTDQQICTLLMKKSNAPSSSNDGNLNKCYIYMSAMSTSTLQENANGKIASLQHCFFCRFSDIYIYKVQKVAYCKIAINVFYAYFGTISERLIILHAIYILYQHNKHVDIIISCRCSSFYIFCPILSDLLKFLDLRARR